MLFRSPYGLIIIFAAIGLTIYYAAFTDASRASKAFVVVLLAFLPGQPLLVASILNGNAVLDVGFEHLYFPLSPLHRGNFDPSERLKR